ncbi:hypothetical protein MAV100_08550 [Mycobacterium avium subsp. hominissuis 100]|nr:hypothetical protein MAV100_08550 [Mycobacterium avium subsp. hominissuis 100]
MLEVTTMLVRSDPFRDLNRFTRQVSGTAAHPSVERPGEWCK